MMGGVDWINLAQEKERESRLENTIMKLGVL